MGLFERLLLGTSLTPYTSPRSQQSKSAVDDAAILAVAPRSYWRSTNRTPTESGIISDHKHAVQYAVNRFPSSPIVLYAHSLGGAAAVCMAAQTQAHEYSQVKGMILENPFGSIQWMVQALYPQKWLPYHYLGRFAFDKWDALSAMRNAVPRSLLHRLSQNMLVILSEKDEVVPNEMGRALFEASDVRSSEAAASLARIATIPGALHDNAWTNRRWRTDIEDYVARIQVLQSKRPS